jgi:PleD family two-component response regulator
MPGGVQAGERVLIVDEADDEVGELLALLLTPAGHRVRVVASADAALDAARRFLPDLVIVDAGLPDDGGLGLFHELRADPRTAYAAIMVLSDDSDVDARIAGVTSGVDDYVVKPVEPRELLARITARLERSRQLRGVSPLTGLPGNFTIQRELDALLASGEPFALVHADLDRFKPFNDRYGFVRGDEAIRVTGRAIVDAVGDAGPLPRFVGHIGGDDFAVLLPPEQVDMVCAGIAARVEASLPPLYDPADRERGFIEVLDRRGRVETAPLLTISMGVALSTLRTFGSPAEVSSVASELKAFAKMQQGSVWRIDRRRT